jgi:hypothetical protein
MTFCGVTPKDLIRPFIPQANIDAGAYQNLVAKEFLPALRKRMASSNTWFQQDGAPAHTAETPVNFLNRKCGTHRIGKGGEHDWPAGSPDLSVCDYWLWNILLRHINACETKIKEQMKTAIREACAGVSAQKCQDVFLGFHRRLEECITNNGGQVRDK